MTKNLIMKLEELPQSETNQFPYQVTIRISIEAKTKLDQIKSQGRSVTKTLRKLIDDGLAKIKMSPTI